MGCARFGAIRLERLTGGESPTALAASKVIQLSATRDGFICGSGITACRFCGGAADWLCDYPIAVGQTCDAPICDRHRQQAANLDYCPEHQREEE